MSYARVESTFWHDDKIRALSEPARSFFMYLITCSHNNRLGCFVLDPYYAGADLKWERLQVEEALRELAEAGRIGYDAHNRVVFICNFIKHNPLINPNVADAAVRDLRGLVDTPLLGLLLEAVEKFWKPHYATLRDALQERVDALGDQDPEDIAAQRFGNNTTNDCPNHQLGEVRSSQGKSGEEGESEGESPAAWMHDIWHDYLGIDGHPLKLTPDRRQKYQAMYDEQLAELDDPEKAWAAVLYAVTRSEHHMANRDYQMPESLLRNENRRSKWVQKAITVLSENGTSEADRKFEQGVADLTRYLKERRAS